MTERQFKSINVYPETKQRFHAYVEQEYGTSRVTADAVVRHLLDVAQE